MSAPQPAPEPCSTVSTAQGFFALKNYDPFAKEVGEFAINFKIN
jgi:hypothetical protein